MVKKYNLLFVSHNGVSIDLAWQAKRQGNSVKYYIKRIEDAEIGIGFVEKIPDWKNEVDWADIVIFDEISGFGTKAEELRKKGKLVIGGTEYTDMLEHDRSFGQEEMKKVGINIIPYTNFKSFDEAVDFVLKNPDEYVIKPCGEVQCNKELLYVGQDKTGKDVIEVLNEYKKNWSDKMFEFQLQKKVTGVEIAVGAFFNGNEFIHPININFEHKRLFPGDVGPSTGEMGTAMFWAENNKLFDKTLSRIAPKLKEEGYVGYIDINCIVDENEVYPLEWTARFGYPTISIQIDGLITPIGEFLYNLSSGKKFELKLKSTFQVGVRVVVPPFPFDDGKTFDIMSKDKKVYFRKDKKKNAHLEGVHIEDVKLVNDEFIIAGNTGLALIICGYGKNMNDATNMAYNRIKYISIPNMFYRNDIGKRWDVDEKKLKKWGYLD